MDKSLKCKPMTFYFGPKGQGVPSDQQRSVPSDNRRDRDRDDDQDVKCESQIDADDESYQGDSEDVAAMSDDEVDGKLSCASAVLRCFSATSNEVASYSLVVDLIPPFFFYRRASPQTVKESSYTIIQ
jgi:hypothetical protein